MRLLWGLAKAKPPQCPETCSAAYFGGGSRGFVGSDTHLKSGISLYAFSYGFTSLHLKVFPGLLSTVAE